MIPSLGRFLLLLALSAAVYNVAMTAWAFYTEPHDHGRRGQLLASAHNAALSAWGLLSLASVALIYLFLANDFSVAYVAGHSNIAQPFIYKISAFWGGQQGSLLMWAWMLTAYGAILAVSTRRQKLEIGPASVAVLSVVSVFFIGLIAFATNPFALVAGAAPKDGQGLTPLLQNYWMQIHPPTLYTGLIGCTVPFALAMGALFHRKFDADWVPVVRRWTLFAWIILTVGIIMGGAWAYETLGWGGYWAWDPVENASLLPWLTLTAFMHSIMIQARRGMLKNWNITLVTLTFLLSVFGTFLTRSGVVSSVHSFAESGIGGYFLGFIFVSLVFSMMLIVYRRDDLHDTSTIESPLSREGGFVLGNIVLVASAFAVLLGTVYPSINEALTGRVVKIEAPFFNRFMVPLGLMLLALTGIGPLLAWRKTTPRAIWKTFRAPVATMIVLSPLLLWLGRWHTGAATAFLLAAFVVSAISLEFYRGTRARRMSTGESVPGAFFGLIGANRHRYGGHIVHLGLVLMLIGITGSSAFKIETQPITLHRGDLMHVGEYVLRFDGFMTPVKLESNVASDVAAQMTVVGRNFSLQPAVRVFKTADAVDPEARAGQEPQRAHIPDIYKNPANDLYLSLTGYDMNKGTVEIKAYVNPLVMWIWVSALLFVGGTLIAMWPARKSRRVLAASQAPARDKTVERTRVPAPVAAAVRGGSREARETAATPGAQAPG